MKWTKNVRMSTISFVLGDFKKNRRLRRASSLLLYEMSCSGKWPVKSTQLAESYRSRNVSADLEPSEESYTRKLLRQEIVKSFTLLGTARKRRPPLPEILLWTTASRHPSESQTSECSDLLSRSRATFVIVAQRQPGKLNNMVFREFISSQLVQSGTCCRALSLAYFFLCINVHKICHECR